MKRKALRLSLIYFCILILLISPSLVYYAMEGLTGEIFLALLIQAAVFSLPVLIFHKNLRLYFYLLLPIVLLAPFALIPTVYFGLDGINTDVLNLVANTSVRESSELFGSMIWQFAAFFVIYVLAYIFLIRKSEKQINLRSGVTVSVLGLAIILLSSALQFGVKGLVAGVKHSFVSFYPTSTVYSLAKFSRKVHRVDHMALIKDFSFDARKKDTLGDRQIYILVIGETARYSNWGINGYSRNTSPRLGKRRDLLTFSNVAAAATMTEQSVPLIITRAGPEDFERHYREKGIEAAFRESGFKTYWLTDQSDYLNIKMHVDEVQDVISRSPSFSARTEVHDITMVDELEKILKEPTDSNLFIIIHTMGSHFNYNMRYPSEFDVFKPSGKGAALNPTKYADKEKMVNAYDNSILYTDFILDSIINLTNKMKAVSYMVYLSDHGEDLFDDDRRRSLHPPVPPSRYVGHIPLFIWTSSKYDSVYPAKLQALKSHRDAPVSSADIFETLLDMANISYPAEERKRSIASPSFEPSAQKVLGGDLKLYDFKDLR